MNKGLIAALLVAALAAGGGYWAGQRSGAAGAAGAAPAGGKTERQVLYYRNPMGLPDTSPVPKKDPMGMDYIPVYAGEAESQPAAPGEVRIGSEKIQKLGVRTEPATRQELGRTVRAAGRIEADERRSYAIAPKFEGYVERLHVNATGQPIGKGQPLFEVYSPELLSAQREYAIARQGVDRLNGAEAQEGMRQLAQASLARLRNWDISEEQLKALASSGEARRTLTFRSPVSGIVSEKKAVQGMRFMPGETLFQVTDLSSVWVVADIFEQDIAQLRAGGRAEVRVGAYPDKVFAGRVDYVYPTLKAETRSVPVRIELANPGGLLKPGMFAQVELPTAARAPVVTVPASAVIDSGTRQVVLVQVGEGRFAPRPVKLGARGGERVEIVDGVAEGERVVVAANFLIDAESNLQAALGGFAPGGAARAPAAGGVGHRAEGRVDEVDAAAGTATVTHGPVASLNWPGMTMEFKPANPAILQQLQPGAAIRFEFVERAPGEWVITSVQPGAPAPAGGKPHAGH